MTSRVSVSLRFSPTCEEFRKVPAGIKASRCCRKIYFVVTSQVLHNCPEPGDDSELKSIFQNSQSNSPGLQSFHRDWCFVETVGEENRSV